MLHAHIKLRNCRYPMACIAPCKGIHADNLGFWIPRLRLRIPGTGFQSLSMEFEFWIVNGIPNSLSCILEFQRPGSRIPDSTKLSWISKPRSKKFQESRFPHKSAFLQKYRNYSSLCFICSNLRVFFYFSFLGP